MKKLAFTIVILLAIVTAGCGKDNSNEYVDYGIKDNILTVSSTKLLFGKSDSETVHIPIAQINDVVISADKKRLDIYSQQSSTSFHVNGIQAESVYRCLMQALEATNKK